MIELKDYELIPSEEDGQAWNVRLLTGPFTETVFRFGSISFNEIEEGMMSFNFHIVYSPDENLTTEVVELQEYAGDLLQAIIRDGIESGSVITKETDE
jgi:hypothetical protein